MISLLANHLWQSTVFAVVAWLLTLAFRRNRAQTRYAILLAASVKFLIPFFLLIAAGNRLHWSSASTPPPRLSTAVQAITQPFDSSRQLRTSTPHPARSRPVLSWLLLTVWFSGFAGLLLFWYLRWRRLQRAVQSGAHVEPGVFGIFRPVLVLPEGIARRLTPEQLQAIVAHELCHIRRHDNFAAAIHMVVEAVFWFHPLVWWLGARLVEERERACDEEVLRLGNNPQAYAEGILSVCKFYVESPLTCVSGVTGSDLKKRIEEIMTHQLSPKLTFGRKLLLAAAACAAITAPLFIGIMNGQSRPQPTQGPAFEVASVKPNTSADMRGFQLQTLPGGTLVIKGVPLRLIITQAYNLPFQAPQRISGAPAWTMSEKFDIDAKAALGMVPAGLSEKSRNDKLMPMLQMLLANRFKLAAHWETQHLPVYALTVTKSGLKLPNPKVDEKDCPEVRTRTEYCHTFDGGQGQGLHGKTIDMSDLVTGLENFTDRPLIDNTGFKGLFDIDTEGWVPMRPRPGPPPGAEPTAEDRAFADPARPTLQAVLDKVGLKLESTKSPVAVLVIDHIERPTEN